ncbi:MAG: DUF5320 domain-containing protein [candidate division Zixibacteria bacterium]|nr:DUF5320 domain-containing protein [candidate division Zixibacteria bacterium]
MPGGDRTGPMGAGPMTGRGAGYCAGYTMPGYMNPVWGRNFGQGGYGYGFGRGFGRGFGMGRGRGFGRGWGMGMGRQAMPYPYYPDQGDVASQPTAENELAYLKDQAKYFGDALENINKRIAKLETKEKGK